MSLQGISKRSYRKNSRRKCRKKWRNIWYNSWRTPIKGAPGSIPRGIRCSCSDGTSRIKIGESTSRMNCCKYCWKNYRWQLRQQFSNSQNLIDPIGPESYRKSIHASENGTSGRIPRKKKCKKIRKNLWKNYQKKYSKNKSFGRITRRASGKSYQKKVWYILWKHFQEKL